jgi:protein-disulfide isomerase
MIKITAVIKIKTNGQPCAKSAKAIADLEARGLWAKIDRVVIANETDPASEGYQLAQEYQVEAAPFFITIEGEHTMIYPAYYQFIKQVFHQDVDEASELAEIVAQNPDLDFI